MNLNETMSVPEPEKLPTPPTAWLAQTNKQSSIPLPSDPTIGLTLSERSLQCLARAEAAGGRGTAWWRGAWLDAQRRDGFRAQSETEVHKEGQGSMVGDVGEEEYRDILRFRETASQRRAVAQMIQLYSEAVTQAQPKNIALWSRNWFDGHVSSRLPHDYALYGPGSIDDDESPILASVPCEGNTFDCGCDKCINELLGFMAKQERKKNNKNL